MDNGYNEGMKRLQVKGKSGEKAILKVNKDVRLLRKREEITIVRLRKEIRLLGKTGEMGILRE